jgi:hypothetical protein
MKKTFGLAMMAMMATVLCSGVAMADTKLLPKGVVVSATCNLADETATITVAGMSGAKIEYYQYEKPQILDSPATVNLNEGRRFQVVDGGGVYALLTPDMAAYPPRAFGHGVGLDCSNPEGCAFLIKCR